MKARITGLFTLVALVALVACVLAGPAFAADLGSTGLQAASVSLNAQDAGEDAGVAADALKSDYALLKKNGYLYRCDENGVACADVVVDGKSRNAAYWASQDAISQVKTLFIASDVAGLADYSATTADLDLTHPRYRFLEDGKEASSRAGLAGAATEAAPQVLSKLSTVSFLLNSKGVSKCAVIADGLFAGSQVAKLVNFASTSLTQIGAKTFYQCPKLKTGVKLPATCTTIGNDAFRACAKLKSVSFGSVVKLGARAFAECPALASVSLPKTCTSVGKRAFASCPALASVKIGTGKTKIGEEAFSGCTALATATLGPCSSIGVSAFSGCAALGSVSITSCTTLGANAFAGDAALSSVNLGSCKTIGASAFANCTALSSITLDGTAAVGASAFANCTALVAAQLSSCTSIGASAFSGCRSLRTVALGACKTIGASAFTNCTALGSVSLASCTTVGASAFEGCTWLSSVALGASTKKFGVRAFAGTRVTQLEFPAKAKSLPADLMGASGQANVPLKKLILRSATVVSIPDSSTFARTPLATAAANASYIYVPQKLLKKYTANKASNKWRAYRTKFRAMPELSKATIKIANVKFNGKYRTPAPRVKYGKKTLKDATDYRVVYSRNRNAGTARAKVVGVGIYNGSKTVTFKVKKAANTLKTKNAVRYVTDTVVKKKGATIYGAPGVDGAQGKTTFTRLKGSSKYLALNATTGAVSVKKGTKAGTYKIKVKVKAAGNSNYKAKTRKMTLTVKVAPKAEVVKHHSAENFIAVAQSELAKWLAGKTPADKYWSSFDAKAESWCSEFVGWCLRESGLIQGTTMPSKPSNAKAYYSFYSSHPELAAIHVNDGTYAPKPGDIVLQIHNGNPSNFWHTEMVTWCDGYNYGGISGGWRVGTTSRNLGNKDFYYFITLKWDAI